MNSNSIWILTDDRAGNRSQVLGVASVLNRPFETKDITYGLMAGLPNAVLGASFLGLDNESRRKLTAPWPSLVIAAGRRTAPVALAIKKNSQGYSRLVQIMNPGAGVERFDLIAVPAHDPPLSGDNVITLTGAPHGLTSAVLETARMRWLEKLQSLPTPRIAVIIGGSTRRREFSAAMASELGQRVSEMANKAGGSVMITTSRRTGAVADVLLDEINCPARIYRWGDDGDNPYVGFLACADAVVVTGDSVSMCSEACAVSAPVQIFAPSSLVTDKHARCHQTLYDGGYAAAFNGEISDQTHLPLNAAVEITAAIQQRFFS
jgi:uncharacterized protein